MHRRKLLLSFSVIMLLVVLGIAAFGVAVKPASAKIKVACIGDSITEGSGYPYKLHVLLGDNYDVENFGVSGSTASKDSKIPYTEQVAYKEAMKFDPDIIIIMLGTNDANLQINHNGENGFEDDYKELVESFQNLSGPEQVYIVKSPPILSQNAGYNDTILADNILPHIDNVASQLNLPTIDMYDTLGHNPDYYWDGVHPNPDGADIIASTIYDEITP